MDQQILPDEQIEKEIHKILQPYKTLKQKIAGKAVQTIHRYNALNSGMDNLLLAAIAHIMDCRIAFSNGWRYGAPSRQDPLAYLICITSFP